MNKLSQKCIADLLELSVTGYASKERDNRQFRLHEAIKLSDFFGIDVREIIYFYPEYAESSCNLQYK